MDRVDLGTIEQQAEEVRAWTYRLVSRLREISEALASTPLTNGTGGGPVAPPSGILARIYEKQTATQHALSDADSIVLVLESLLGTLPQDTPRASIEGNYATQAGPGRISGLGGKSW